MIETWKQLTCDACGGTAFCSFPYATSAQAREDTGFTKRGRKDLCVLCSKAARK